MSVKGEIVRERPEVQYRKIEALNQSGLCLYDENPMQFYKQYVLLEPKKEDETTATLIGSLVDFYLLECNGNEEEFNQKFDEHFCLFEGTKGTAQVFILADELFEISKRHIVDGVIEGNFEVMFQEAFLNTQAKEKYKGKTWQTGLEDFNTNGKDYYDTLLRSIGRRTVDLSMVETAKRITGQLLNDENLGWIFQGNDNIEQLNKFPIEFEWKGFTCKMEADCIHIDHDLKIIQPYDLKTTWDNESFDYSYLKRKYYIQNGWYHHGVHIWARKEGLEDYTVLPMSFIVADSSVNQRRPLLYQTSPEHIHEAYYGFTFNRRKYRGIEELLLNIKWAEENGIWNIDPTNHKNGQIVRLQTFNEI
jgi:hypothetical protein